MWCLVADTHLKLLDCIVSGTCFLATGMLNCNLSHHRSVAVLCMLYKIRCNTMHPLCGALPVPYVPARVTCGALIAYPYTYAHISILTVSRHVGPVILHSPTACQRLSVATLLPCGKHVCNCQSQHSGTMLLPSTQFY